MDDPNGRITLGLPEDIAAALAPLFAALPQDKAMPQLVVRGAPEGGHTALLEEALATPALSGKPALSAGLWLYVDDLDRSHSISQGLGDETGSFWHGIMHRREGDFGNSHYWFDRAGRHPAMADIPGYDPRAFIDRVAHADNADAELLALQRREWRALFSWCARRKDNP